jgi:hypothetical protein
VFPHSKDAMRYKSTGIAIAAGLVGCSVAAFAPHPSNSLQQPQPIDVRILSTPEQGSDSGLTVATWALVLLTGALCVVTWRSAKAALDDATRLRREVEHRELNTAAHKAAATAEHVGQLAARVPLAYAHFISVKPSSDATTADPVEYAAQERSSRLAEMKDFALSIIVPQSAAHVVLNLAIAQRRLDEHLVQLDVMKEAIIGELEAIARQTDAAEREAAAHREEGRLARLRIEFEVGQCNKLIFVLGQMLSTLEDTKQILFDDPRQKLGREPLWNEVGAVVGAPTEGPEFLLGEYTFLLTRDDPTNLAPDLLGSVYTAEANFRQVLARVNQRSLLFHEFNETRAAARFTRGEEGVIRGESSGAVGARIKELTSWLEDDLGQWIPAFKALFPRLYRVLDANYPGSRFIRYWPIDKPGAPAL